MMIALLAAALVASVPPPGLPLPEGYATLVDDTATIVVAAPDGWTDIDTTPGVNEDESARPYIAASPDIESFKTSFATPGLVYAALPRTDDLLAVFETYGLQSGCVTIEARTYDDPVFLGVIQIGTSCGELAMTWSMVVANPIVSVGEPVTVLLQVQSADPSEIETVLRTFNLVGSAAERIPTTTTP
jgi:hypothetical protein